MITFLKFMMGRETTQERFKTIESFLEQNAPNKDFVVGILSKKFVIFYEPNNIELQNYLDSKGLMLMEDYAVA